MSPVAEGLLNVLVDPFATVSARDDAAMDLADHDAPEVRRALLMVAQDACVEETIRASCGESLAELWIKSGGLDREALCRLSGEARREAESVIRESRPEWLQ